MNATLQYHLDQALSNVGMSVKAVIDIPNIKTSLSESFGNVKKLMNSIGLPFFVGLKVDPFKTRLKEFLFSDNLC